MKTFLLIVILCSLAGTSVAEVYRWTDDSGKIVFGDKPPKGKNATTVNIENTQKSGTQFANPEQIKNFERGANQARPNKPAPTKRINSDCRRYIGQLNKVEIFLEHTNSPRDQLKARDLRNLIKRSCGNTQLTQKFSDGYCNRYRRNLRKTEVFLEHTDSPRDRQKVADLQNQITRECE
jgi:Domain of unknown function (DUF4124)